MRASTYDADSYADDLPYWDLEHSTPHLVVPYTLDTNDMRFASPQGFNSGTQFYDYLKDAFDVLYAEGATAPKMLSIGLHCRLAGRPAPAARLPDSRLCHGPTTRCGSLGVRTLLNIGWPISRPQSKRL